MCWNNYKIYIMENIEGIQFTFMFKIAHGRSRENSANYNK